MNKNMINDAFDAIKSRIRNIEEVNTRLGLTDEMMSRRIDAIMTSIENDKSIASDENSLLRLYTGAHSYEFCQDRSNIALGAAMWIRNELFKVGKICEAYDLLFDAPTSGDEMPSIPFWMPQDDNFICKLTYVVSHRNGLDNSIFCPAVDCDLRHIYDSIVALIPTDRKNDTHSQFIALRNQILSAYGKQYNYIQSLIDRFSVEGAALYEMDMQQTFIDEFQIICRIPNDYTALYYKLPIYEDFDLIESILHDIKVDNPCEICFAALDMFDANEDVMWTFGPSIGALEHAAAKLPWDKVLLVEMQDYHPTANGFVVGEEFKDEEEEEEEEVIASM